MLSKILIDFLPFAIIGLHFIDKWMLSQGKLWQVYLLAIAGSSCVAVFNILLYIEYGKTHSSILLFSVNATWTVAMSIKGIMRLINKQKELVEKMENIQ